MIKYITIKTHVDGETGEVWENEKQIPEEYKKIKVERTRTWKYTPRPGMVGYKALTTREIIIYKKDKQLKLM